MRMDFAGGRGYNIDKKSGKTKDQERHPVGRIKRQDAWNPEKQKPEFGKVKHLNFLGSVKRQNLKKAI